MGGFTGPIEGLPELIHACNGKDSVFAAIVGQAFQPSYIAQVGFIFVMTEHSEVSECWFLIEV